MKQRRKRFKQTLVDRRTLPPTFCKRCYYESGKPRYDEQFVSFYLNLYTYDMKADDTEHSKCTSSVFKSYQPVPMMMVYAYHAYNYRMGGDCLSMLLHQNYQQQKIY